MKKAKINLINCDDVMTIEVSLSDENYAKLMHLQQYIDDYEECWSIESIEN